MGSRNPFADILSSKWRKAVILDGGLGTELERCGKDYGQDPLWSARVLADDPGVVQTVHRAYYDAGADVATTCSYQATHSGFQKAGFSLDDTKELFRRSVRVAAAARDEFWSDYQEQAASAGEAWGAPEGSWKIRRAKPLVAFSSGPFAAVLADGSEYTGNYAGKASFEQLVDFHRKKLQEVEGEDYDIIAFETVPALKEAQAIAHLLRTEPQGKPAWLTFNCRDESRLADGSEFAREAVPLAFEAPSLVAIGVNCVPPRFVPALINSAAEAVNGAENPPMLIAYPNSGEGWVNKTGKWDGRSDLQGSDLGQVGLSWVDAGARIVGGCCRTTPEYITSLASALT